MSNQQQATEIDRLLTTPISTRKSYYNKNNDSESRHGRFIVAGAATLALVFSVHWHHNHKVHKDKTNFKAKDQLGALQKLTENSLMGVLSASAAAFNSTPSLGKHHHSKGKAEIIGVADKNLKQVGLKENDIFHCTSQVVIMRHCDKVSKVTIRGKKQMTDTIDRFGDRHCSAKGKRRSKYIATIFVDPDDYQALVVDEDHMKKKSKKEGMPPPVPMIESSLCKVSNAAARKKPQFLSPLHIYALSSERGKHKNCREIETVTPLSKKFHLDIDDRFGIYEEGDLASDIFENLSKSVTQDVDMMMRLSPNAADSSVTVDKSSLCSDGMTLVNWQHSRIPALARALGCGKKHGCPKKYNGSDFDTIWLLTFQYSLLLGDTPDDMDADVPVVALESLSKSASLRQHHKKQSYSSGYGNWKISAELVNEGFEVN